MKLAYQQVAVNRDKIHKSFIEQQVARALCQRAFWNLFEKEIHR